MQSQADDVLQLVHSDLVGPIGPLSLGGSQYILTVLDDYSGFACVAFLRNKSDTYEGLVSIFNYLENTVDKRIKRLRSDNGTEYVNQQMQKFLNDKGIAHETTAPYSPESNGKAERLNRSIIDGARSILNELQEINQLVNHKKLWAEAVNAMVYVRNRSLTKSTHSNVKDNTPYELIFGTKPDLSNLRIFGSKVKVRKPVVQHEGKFEDRVMDGIHVGYSSGNAYRIYVRSTDHIIVSRDVLFDEETIQLETTNKQQVIESGVDNVGGETEKPVDNSGNGSNRTNAAENCEAVATGERPKRATHPPAWTKDYDLMAFLTVHMLCTSAETNIPENYDDAMHSGDIRNWEEAINSEINAMVQHNVFKVCDVPPGRKLIQSRWVFDVKRDSDGHIVRYKARLVARGFTQEEGVDYTEVFAPVTRYETFRFIAGYTAASDYELEQIDIRTAFLYCHLKEDIYMEPPKVPIRLHGKYDVQKWTGKSWKLMRAIYGLKQSARLWNQELRCVLNSVGLIPSSADPSLFTMDNGEGLVLVIVYVDDVLIVARTKAICNNIKKLLSRHFEVRDLKESAYFLGIKISRDRGTRVVRLSQRRHILDLIRKFKLHNTKSRAIPMGVDFERAHGSTIACNTDANEYPVRAVIGALMFLATTTRPDIMYCTSYMSRFMARPTHTLWKAALAVLQYLKGTVDNELVIMEKVGSILQDTQMQIGGTTYTPGNPRQGTCLPLEKPHSHGNQNYRLLLRAQPWKRNILHKHSMQRRHCGSLSCVGIVDWRLLQ